MTKRLFYSTLFLFSVTLLACDYYDLEFQDYITFNVLDEKNPIVGFQIKHGFGITEQGAYLIGGRDSMNQMTIYGYTKAGDYEFAKSLGEKGGIVDMIKGEAEGEWLLLANDGIDSYLVQYSETSGIQKIDSLRYQANQQLGLVDVVSAWAFTLSPEGDIFITGSLRQSLGGQRMMAMRVNPDFSLQWLRTYLSNNTTAFKIAYGLKANIIISSKDAANEYLLWNIDQNGVKQWLEKIPFSQVSFFPDFAIKEDSLIYAISSHTQKDSLLVSIYNLSGDLLRQKNYNNPAEGALSHTITTVKDTSLILFSSFTSTIGNTQPDEYQMQLIDASDNKIWEQNIPASISTIPLFCKPTKDNGFVLFGVEQVQNTNVIFHRLMKTDEEGFIR